MAFVDELVDDEIPDPSSGVGVLVDFCDRLRVFLDEHAATDDEFGAVVWIFLRPFLQNLGLSWELREEIRLRCGEALGAQIRRIH